MRDKIVRLRVKVDFNQGMTQKPNDIFSGQQFWDISKWKGG